MKKIKQISNWLYVDVQERVDCFNFEEFKSKLDLAAQTASSQIALDFSQTRFLCVPSIKYLSELASRLSRKGGSLAIVGTPERLKRQIEIYTDVDDIGVYRRPEQLSQPGYQPENMSRAQ